MCCMVIWDTGEVGGGGGGGGTTFGGPSNFIKGQ